MNLRWRLIQGLHALHLILLHFIWQIILIGSSIEKGVIETANGIVEVRIFEVDSISALGHTLYNKSVQVYDFFAQGILSDYDGVLGIDFFENTRFCIDMSKQTVEIEEFRF